MTDQPNDRGICGARTEPTGFLRAATCELLYGHLGWHRDGGMSWTDGDDHERVRALALANPEVREAYIKARVDAAYERGLAEGRRLERQERDEEVKARD